MKFVAHGGPCTCLAIGQKSGRVLATGGDDKKVNLWAIGKPNIIMSLSGHTQSIECVKFGYNEDLVCAASLSGAIRIWNLEAAKLVRALTGHKSAVKCVDFHPYGDFLASGSVDSTIKLWDIRKKGCMYTYKGHIKDVYCLKFSPDGRWLASGGDEGSVKIWDLPAGKLLKEFKEHTGPVVDVCFHPNEFLLSSAGSDGTVKFWDLETFTQVSTTVNEAGPIRKILYHPDGRAIFSASRDVLKVYGWEPARTLDTVVMGWGKVNDIAISENQLIAGSYSLTNVSVFVIDLTKVQPFGSSAISKSIYCSNPLSRQNARKNFFHGHCSTTHSQLESLESNRSEETETGSDEPEEESPVLGITQFNDFKEVFAPSREYSLKLGDSDLSSISSFDYRKTPTNLSSLFALDPFSNMGQKISTSKPTNSPSSPIAAQSPNNSQAQNRPDSKNHNNLSLPLISPHSQQSQAIVQPITQSVPIKQAVSTTTINVPQTGDSIGYTAKISTSIARPALNSSQSLTNLSQKAIKSTNLVHPRQSEIVSIVKPVVNDSKSSSQLSSNLKTSIIKDNNQKPVNAAVVFPEKQQRQSDQKINSPVNKETPIDLIPETRDRPAGLDLDDFLPKHLQDNIRLGYQPQPEMSETEAMQAILRGHKSVITALSHRRKNLQIIFALWTAKDPRNALEEALNIEDQAVIVDVLNVIILKPALWTLDLCQILVQPIYDLLQSRYESYMSTGCSALKLILKNFATIIKTNITAPPGIGVDISREERYHKCMGVYNHLLNVRAFILKRQTLQGKLGRTFRELSILFQNLE
ncbi:katanin p80 isoform X2 [Brevipalpus obovatus]|uniref:katanin p80 isoform X2 n=1 Tax=Brevipalpus obovatus TaxID=246614 RepID=UPI003D9E67B9